MSATEAMKDGALSIEIDRLHKALEGLQATIRSHALAISPILRASCVGGEDDGKGEPAAPCSALTSRVRAAVKAAESMECEIRAITERVEA